MGNGKKPFFEIAPPNSSNSEGTLALVNREVSTVSDVPVFYPTSGLGEEVREDSIAKHLSTHHQLRKRLTRYVLSLGGSYKTSFSKLDTNHQRPMVSRDSTGISYQSFQVPHQAAHPPPIVHNQEQNALIDFEVKHMTKKAAIHVVNRNEKEQGFVSALFLVPKKGGGQRSVVNLRPVNQYIPYKHFKMEGIHMLRDLLRKDDYLVKVDLKDAYFRVPV